MAAAMAPERDFRGPGCTDACEVVKAIVPGRFGRTDLLLHDPDTHEEYGRLTSGVPGGVIVWTGSLLGDLRTRDAFSAGGTLNLTLREWQILEFLALRIGRWCTAAEIVAPPAEVVPADVVPE